MNLMFQSPVAIVMTRTHAEIKAESYLAQMRVETNGWMDMTDRVTLPRWER